MSGFRINEKKLVLEQATLIFEIELFLLIWEPFYVPVTLNNPLFSGISFLRIICKVITFLNIEKRFLPLNS